MKTLAIGGWKRVWRKFVKHPFGFLKRSISKSTLDRMKYAKSGGYDASKYWGDRLTKYRLSFIGVGDEGLSEEDNMREYSEAARTFSQLCRQVRINFAKARVLDIGCGNGFYANLLADMGVTDYTGVDITDALFPALHSRFPTFRFLKSDIGASDLDGQYDLILMIDVAEHIVSDAAFSHAMVNVLQCLAPRGVFVVTAAPPRRLWLASFYVKYRSLDAFKEMFPRHIVGEPLLFRDKYLVAISSREAPCV